VEKMSLSMFPQGIGVENQPPRKPILGMKTGFADLSCHYSLKHEMISVGGSFPEVGGRRSFFGMEDIWCNLDWECD
jgi:hypothetical protein